MASGFMKKNSKDPFVFKGFWVLYISVCIHPRGGNKTALEHDGFEKELRCVPRRGWLSLFLLLWILVEFWKEHFPVVL